MSVQPCRLLILDDSPEDRTFVRLLLEDATDRAWTFIEEEKCVPALEMLASGDVDCILLDYQLPDMSGIQFLRELTGRFGELRFPVVMFTGSGRTSVAVEALKSGAQDYLSKDFIRVDTLLRAIDNAIDRVRLLREREAHRAELEASNARLRLLEAAVQATGESVLITDAELEEPGPRIIFANRAFTKMTGYSVDEVIGKTPRILQGPKTSRDLLDKLRRNLTEGRPFSGEGINYRKDGSEFILNWSIAPIAREGGPTCYVSVQRDATQRHLAGEKLRQSEERLELALRGADLGLWDMDVSTGKVTYDGRWAGMLGYCIEEISPTFEGWSALVHPEDLPAAIEKLESHYRGEAAAYEAEFRMRNRDGEWRWILARGKVLERLPDGKPRRVVGTHHDITERRLAEVALRQSNEDLQQFAYAVSHDLQEPIRTVTLFSQLLTRRTAGKLDDEEANFLSTIQFTAQKAIHMITDLLDYARAGASERELLLEDCPLGDILNSVLAGYRHRIEETQAVIEHGPLPVLHSNRAQLELLLQNLVGNALKYQKPGVPPRISVTAHEERGYWTIAVQDNGIGFAPHQAEVIFGVFKRLRSGDQSGTGLGLAICKRIVERQAGRIWAESSPGVGSTFRFKLPAGSQAYAAGGGND